jgi:imidazole glycerol-phosphate synthase subunit HisH
MSPKITIIDYGMGNLNSVRRKFSRINVNAIISSNPSDLLRAEKIVLPGVGHFQHAIKNIIKIGLWEVLNEAVIVKKIPILGICLGMQLMARRSEEGNIDGLGWFDADVVKFQVEDYMKYKVPHTGWNQIIRSKESLLMKEIPDLSEFYFVHAYHFRCNNPVDILNETEYEYKFTSAVEKENIFGVQYHPEKSHDAGELLLRNFVNI